MMDEKPFYACSALAIDAQGKKIETVESRSRGDRSSVTAGICRPRRLAVRFLHPRFRFGNQGVARQTSQPTPEESRGSPATSAAAAPLVFAAWSKPEERSLIDAEL